MNEKLFIVDSFTHEPFRGNPAGIHLVEHPLDEDRMQAIAKELNLSETAFVVMAANQSNQENAELPIRYFSPIMEIPLCGHATLAASKVLFELGHPSPIRFRTIQDRQLTVRPVGDCIEMEFPVYQLENAVVSKSMMSALGIEKVLYVGFNHETNILMLEIESADQLQKLEPDYQKLLDSHDTIHGLSVTARSNGEFDFYSRFFWPWSGGKEDPVTGGTHTFLANYWAEKLGKRKLRSFQASQRTGSMEVEITDDQKLLIRGQAVVVIEGMLRI